MMPTASSEVKTVNIYEAKTKLSKLVDLASSGTDVVIARAGKPVARLTSLNTKKKRSIKFGALEGKGWIAEDFDAPLPDDLLAQFEGR
jgi:prevent-host-death family protein